MKGMFSDKRILLGVTGSIAAYKAVDLLRRLRDQGAAVSVVMTGNATRFVSRLTFEVLSGQPVLVDEFLDWHRGGIAHIEATDSLDAALIAPATANIIGKAAAGIADDALSSCLLALRCPVLIAPAMNERMYRNPLVQKNIRVLKERGMRFIEPESGPLACGTSGQGRLANTETILRELAAALAPEDLAGITILVTAGPTREPIDAVRFISNPSTGKMGYALARAAQDRGARVILISGPVALAPPSGAELVSVTTAREMKQAVMDHLEKARAVIMAAAVSDFRPVAASERKIKKDRPPEAIPLERTDDILAELGTLPGKRLLVGFAAETDSVIDNAREKLKRKNLDLIVANDVLQPGAGFGHDTNAVTLIDRFGSLAELPVMPKEDIAAQIMQKIAELLVKQGILP